MQKRVRFFPGQLLTSADFQAEQAYQLEKRRLHNLVFHGSGVIKGLQVMVDGSNVTMFAGFAIDPLGNEIVVDTSVSLTIAPGITGTCSVIVKYTETPSDPVPVAGVKVEFSRIVEGFAASIVEDYVLGEKTPAVRVAVLTREGDKWRTK